MRMVFQDGSDFATIGEEKEGEGTKGKSRLPGVEEVKRGEDFVTAGVSDDTFCCFCLAERIGVAQDRAHGAVGVREKGELTISRYQRSVWRK